MNKTKLRHAVLSNLILYLGLLVPHLILDLCINPYTWVIDQRVYTSDQLIFEIIGKAWANGIPAYTYYFDHKGPFLFLWFMIGYKLAGTYAGVTVLNAFWNTISSVMLYKIIYKLNWFRTEKGNRRNALASTLLLFVCQYVITANMTILVTNISMPFLLACVLLLMHWHEKNTFLTCDWKHAVYGLCCMLAMLCRVSDALYVVLVYICVWMYHTKKSGIRRTIRQPLLCIITGMLPFAAFAAYFCKINAFDEFFRGTVTANFGYIKNAIPEQSKWAVTLIFVLITGLLAFLGYKRRSVDNKILACYVIPQVLHRLL